MSDVTHEDIQELISVIAGLRDAIDNVAVGSDAAGSIQKAIANGVDQAFRVDTQDVRKAIADGVGKALSVYPSQVLDAIADGTREALEGER